MIESQRCRVCEEVVDGRTIPVSLAGQQFDGLRLCEPCRHSLDRGSRLTIPDGARDTCLDGPGLRLTEPELLGLIDVGRRVGDDSQVSPEAGRGLDRRLLLRGDLRALGGDLEDAMAASARGDWAGSLEAVRMIQGRAVVTRATLERRLGSAPTGDDLPPLVRAVRAVGLLIDQGEVDSLSPDDLRVRMHAVLQTLDYELSALLQPPD